MHLHLGITIAAAALLAASPEIVQLELAGSQHIDHATHHVQGLAVTRDTYWISSVDRAAKRGFVFRVDRASGKVVQQRELTFGDQFHPGGIDFVENVLWVPVAEYRPRSTTTILKLDAKTLETLGSFTVDDHIGCLAVIRNESRVDGGRASRPPDLDEANAPTPSDNKRRQKQADGGQDARPPVEILAANWDARTFFRLDAKGKKLGEVANPLLAKYQDMKMLDGRLLAAGTELIDGRQVPVVDRLDPSTLELVSRWQPTGALHTGGSNFCREGCAVFDDQLYLMPEDGPNTTIYRFALPNLRTAR